MSFSSKIRKFLNFGKHDVTTSIHIKTLIVRTNDLDQSKRFYHNTLGLDVLRDHNNSVLLANQNTLMPLIELRGPSKTSSTRYSNANGETDDRLNEPQYHHIGFLLDTKRSWISFIHHILDQEIPITGTSEANKTISFYIKDPDDNLLEFYTKKETKDHHHYPTRNFNEGHDIEWNLKQVLDTVDDDYVISTYHFEIAHLHLQVSKLNAQTFRHFFVDGLKALEIESYHPRTLNFKMGSLNILITEVYSRRHNPRMTRQNLEPIIEFPTIGTVKKLTNDLLDLQFPCDVSEGETRTIVEGFTFVCTCPEAQLVAKE